MVGFLTGWPKKVVGPRRGSSGRTIFDHPTKNARPTTRSPVVHMKKNMADYCDEDYEENEEECEEEFDEEEASYTSDLY